MSRRPLVAGNAKMNLDRRSMGNLLDALAAELRERPVECDVAYCPPFPLLPAAAAALAGSPVLLGAQNVHWEPSGAYTGEVSVGMLLEAGCRLVLVGHSERRTLFGETDAGVGKKAAVALEVGLIPVVCIGETEAEREAGATEVVLSRQLVGAFAGIAAADPSRILVAYEPVWAIGTGKTATPEIAQAAHGHIRRELSRRFGDAARGIRILYGGSVNAGNAAALMAQPDVDGALVGGASLDAGSFLAIVRAAGTAPVTGD